MKDALGLVKMQNYTAAQKAYSNIYIQTGNLAVGFNEAILAEINGYLPQAIKIMEAFIDKMSKTIYADKYLSQIKLKSEKELVRMKADI